MSSFLWMGMVLGTPTPNFLKTSIVWYSCRFKNRRCAAIGAAATAFGA